jgi:hypothetical protein
MPNPGRGQASERGVNVRGTPGRGLMRGRGNPARSGRGAPRGGRRHDIYGVSRWPPTGTGAMIPLANLADMETNDDANNYELEYERNRADAWMEYTSSLDTPLQNSQVSDSDHINEL